MSGRANPQENIEIFTNARDHPIATMDCSDRSDAPGDNTQPQTNGRDDGAIRHRGLGRRSGRTFPMRARAMILQRRSQRQRRSARDRSGSNRTMDSTLSLDCSSSAEGAQTCGRTFCSNIHRSAKVSPDNDAGDCTRNRKRALFAKPSAVQRTAAK